MRPAAAPVLSARLVAGAVVALAGVLVGFCAALSAARGNADVSPSLTAIGSPPHGRASVPAPPAVPQPSVETARLRAHVPEGWSVESQSDDEIVLAGPHVLLLLSDSTPTTVTTEDGLATAALEDDQKRHPDTKLCHDPIAAAVDNGPDGRAFALCFTSTPQNGRAVAADVLEVAALVTGRDSARHALSERALFADGDAGAAAAELPAVLATVRWRSYSG